MRITDVYGKLNERAVESTGQGVAPGQAPKGGDAGNRPGAPGGEKVTLSSEAQKLADKSAADAAAAKVQKLRAAIADGSFRVDPHAIAKRIVEGG